MQVVTPLLRLRTITDDLANELGKLAAGGIHDPDFMPFSIPWSDADDLETSTPQYFSRCYREAEPQHWVLPMAVLVGNVAVGVCTVSADRFPARRTVTTGSWLGLSYQRRGYGREMRAAALHLAFAGFGARRATTSAWHDNAASLGVTRALPYRHTRTVTQLRRQTPDRLLHFSMSRRRWETIRRTDIALIDIAPVCERLEIPQPAN